jgi:soluble lytic murein transglycosylase
MPRVPTYDGRTVAPDAAPRVQLSSAGATPDAFGASVGDALMRSGDALSQHAMRMQDEDNATEARAADARFAAEIRAAMFGAPDGSSTGYYATKGKPAVDGYDATAKALAEKRKAVAASLNPGALRLFDEIAQRRTESELDRMASHAATERRNYHASVFESTVKSAADDAVAWFSNAPKFNQSMATLRGTIQEYAESEGWAPERTVAALRDAESGVRRSVAERMVLDDAIGAAAYVESNRDKLTGADQLALDRILTPAMHDQQAEEDVMAGVGQPIGPSRITSQADLGRFVSVIEQIESRGRDFGKGGALLTSAKGAQGRMQVMPATQADPGYGVRPARDNSPAELARVGREYAAAMVVKYDGNTALAAAAYNAGPGAVDKWLKSIGDPRTGTMSNAEWAARLPVAETRNYVSAAARGMGGGRLTNAPAEIDEAAALARIDALAEAGGWDAGRTNRAKEKLTQFAAINRRLLNQQERALSDGAWAAFDAGQKLPPSMLAALPRTTREQIKAAEARRATGADVETDPVQFVQVQRLAAEDPERFATLDINKLRGVFSPADIRAVGAMQNDIIANGGKSPKAITHAKIVSTTRDLAEAAGITLVGKKGGSREKAAERIAAFQNKVAADVAAYVAENKRQPDDDTIRKFADRWLMEATIVGSGVISDDVKPLFEVEPGAKIVIDVPNSFRERVRAAAARNGRPMPSEREIGLLYQNPGLR